MRAVSACYEAVKPRQARSHLLEPVTNSSPLSSSPRRGKPHYGPARRGELPRDNRAPQYDPLRAYLLLLFHPRLPLTCSERKQSGSFPRR